jgi:NAD(P)-dependent dehydrogenase (short-subunit alcohol dehydrogenase family)
METGGVSIPLLLPRQRAIVTGGARGIGRTIATTLARAGAAVIIADINGDGAEQTAAELRQQELRAAAAPADVSDHDSVHGMVTAALRQLGGIDVLVNCAGIFPTTSIEAMTVEEWDRVMAVNARGVFLCSQAVLPEFMEQRSGAVVNIASRDAFVPKPSKIHYAASKTAVVSLTRSFAEEFGAFGARANCVAPGLIDTPALRKERGDAWFAEMEQQVPRRKAGWPQDIANAVLFLASPLADYINGATIHVNGGSWTP